MASKIEVTLDTSGFDRVMREYPQRVETFLDGYAESMVTDIKLSFGTSPSPPGGPPGVDTGTLRASMHWTKTAAFERTISDGVEYGIYLEDGTERMGARPFMGPVFAEAQKTIEAEAAAKLKLE